MISHLKFAILFTLSFSLNAQISQPVRYEREHRNSDHEFIIISMNEVGIALVRDTEKFESGKKIWEVVVLDTLLEESWNTKIDIGQRMNILGHEYRDGNIYLVFQEAEGAGRSISISELHVTDKSIKTHSFKPEINIHFTHFSVLKNKAIFGGYINKEPTVLLYDLLDEKARVIPGVLQPNVDLADVRMNINDTFNVLLIEKRSNKDKKMIVRTFDPNGVLVVENEINIDEDKSIVEAMTSSLVRDELIIVGTWTYGVRRQAAGIFSVMANPFSERKVNYYDFAMLNHFLDGLKPKRVAKIKAKAEWRRSVGKPVEFRSNLFPVRIEETKEGFSFLGETYEVSSSSRNTMGYPPYGYYPSSYYSPYGFYPYGFSPMPNRYYNNSYYPSSSYPPSSYSTTSEIKMKDASLISFDAQGKMISDESLHFPEIKLSTKEQVSDFIINNGSITLACKSEDAIFVKRIEPGDKPPVQEKIKPETKASNETIRGEKDDNSSIRTWYSRYFFVYGYHTLRDTHKKTSRDVFYINKIKVD